MIRLIARIAIYGTIPAMIAYAAGFSNGKAECARTLYAPTVVNTITGKKYTVNFSNKTLEEIDEKALRREKERKELTDKFR